MKKAYSIIFPALLALSQSAMAHSGEVLHIHPHGENALTTTWLIAAVTGLALGVTFLVRRSREK